VLLPPDGGVSLPPPPPSTEAPRPRPSHTAVLPQALMSVLSPNDFPGHQDYITSISIDPETDRLACGSRDCTAIVFDLTTGQKIATLQHDDWVNGVVFVEITPQTGNFGAAKTLNNSDASDGKSVSGKFQAAKSFYRSTTVDLSASVDGATLHLIVTATENGLLTWWGSKYAVTHQFRLSYAALTKMLLQGGCLFVLSIETIFVVSATLRVVLRQIRVASEPLSLAVTADGCSIFCGHLDGVVAVYDVAQCTAVKRFAVVEKSPVRAIAIDASCSYVFCGCDEGIVGVWSIGLSELLRSFAPHQSTRRGSRSLAIYSLVVLQIPIPMPSQTAKRGVPTQQQHPHEFAVVIATASMDGTIALSHDHGLSNISSPQVTVPSSIPKSVRPLQIAAKAPLCAEGGEAAAAAASTVTTIVPFACLASCLLPVVPLDPVTNGPAFEDMYLLAGEADGRVVRFRLVPTVLYCC
jgi:WD40 repeat protein